MVKNTYAVVRFDNGTQPESASFPETEIDASSEELIGLSFDQAKSELMSAASRYLDFCVSLLRDFGYGNYVGSSKDHHSIEYSVSCCFGIVRSDGWHVDPETGDPLQKIEGWTE